MVRRAAVSAQMVAMALALALPSLPGHAQQRPPAAPSAPAAAPDIPRASFIVDMDTEFRTKDADKDGRLTRAEVELFERNSAFNAALASNRQLFARLDVDRNGQISPGEFAALVGQPAQPDVTATMTRFDTNRDQVITLVEYRAATLANFDKLDADHDGIVTAAEMRAGGVAPATR